jgi:cytochrome c peroxidase
MKTESHKSLCRFTHQPLARHAALPVLAHPSQRGLWCYGAALLLALAVPLARTHIVQPEKLHPVAESYRRVSFILNVIPVAWDQVDPEIVALAEYWRAIDAQAADNFLKEGEAIIAKATIKADPEKGIEPMPRRQAASQVFELCTRVIPVLVRHHLKETEKKLGDRLLALAELKKAQGIWQGFEDTLSVVDPEAYRAQGQAWLQMASALGTPGLLGAGAVPFERENFRKQSQVVLDYLDGSYGKEFRAVEGRRLAPAPIRSATFNKEAKLSLRLPPGANINKQLPRPRQILNMTARGVDESETALIALGDMAFDSAEIFGEPARSLGINCNTCHNKSITNPKFFIPGLSVRPGGADITGSFFAGQLNNGHFDPLDIPDLRGIRFLAPYGRNGRFESLRDFSRFAIVNEFNGAEPDPMLIDAIVAYMNEFDFLPNRYLNRDGTLNEQAPADARRGEKIFTRPFPQMNGMSCATCHVPSANFVDHKRHDIGTVRGSEPFSRDGALKTQTLLGIKHTPPYFHDGSQETLRDVSEYFNKYYKLGLSAKELADLTAYVETVGDGIEPMEDTLHTLEAEMEEFSFFISTFEFLDEKNKPDLMGLTFRTIATEIRAHKWDLQDYTRLPVLDKMAALMDQADAARKTDDRVTMRKLVGEYREMYEKNKEVLK